jgi:hypothetical protein
MLQFHLEEMADPKLRGALSACILLTYSVGIMLISLIGTTVSWPMAAGLAAAVGFVDLVGYSLLHKSPVWLVRNNRINQANEVFSWLWGPGRQEEVRHIFILYFRQIHVTELCTTYQLLILQFSNITDVQLWESKLKIFRFHFEKKFWE